MKKFTKLEQVKAYREGGKVQRCHTLPIIGQYNVAEHSYGVATLLLALHPNPSISLIKAALSHDVAERWTGDIPHPAKKLFKELDSASKNLETYTNYSFGCEYHLASEEEKHWLSSCDLLDLFCWASDQLYMGNKNVLQMLDTCTQLLRSEKTPPEVYNVMLGYQADRLDDFIYPGAKDDLRKD